jgi:3-dehydroquinate synthase
LLFVPLLAQISHVAHKPTWDLMVAHGKELVETGFGRKTDGESSEELAKVAATICRNAIRVMLDLESGNLHEIKLDRVIASGESIPIPSTPIFCLILC